jgi:hypothetical protein
MDLENYNIGAGLNKKVYVKLMEILDNYDDSKVIRVLEFGSGMSSKFFIDYQRIYNKKLELVSFDDSEEWCYKKSVEEDKVLKLHIRKLIKCKDNDYNYQIENKIINKKMFYKNMQKTTWRQKNCFYDIQDNDIEGLFDIVILDGPNGNGRNLAYNYIREHLNKDAIILIDDFDARDGDFDYEFVDILKYNYDVEEIYKYDSDLMDNYEKGGKFIFFKFILN